MKKKSFLVIIFYMPFMLYGGWDDIENDVKMMEESVQDSSIRIPKETTPTHIQEPVSTPQNQITRSPYQSAKTSPNSYHNAKISNSMKPWVKNGLSVKAVMGAGTWTLEDDGTEINTGDYRLSMTDISFHGLNGILELTYGWGNIIYPNGGERSISHFALQTNPGNRIKNSGFLFYGIINLDFRFIDFSDKTTSSTYLTNETVTEMKFGLGLGTGYRFYTPDKKDFYDLFVEYVYTMPLMNGRLHFDGATSSWGYTTINSYDLIHKDGKFIFGIAAYF